METIEINVPLETAKNWQEVDAKIQMELAKIFSRQIDAIVQKRAESDLDQLLKEIRIEAKANGLTPDILEQILNES